MELLHEKIKRLRDERGIRQNFFAEKAGIGAPFLSDIEHNRRNPSTKTLEAIARVLDMTVDELLKDVVMYVFDKPWVIMARNEFLEMVLEED